MTPHSNLEVVELASWESPRNVQSLIQDVLVAVRTKKLPSLHTIKLTPPWMYKNLPFKEREVLGVTLEVVIRPEATFKDMTKRHHA